MRVGSLFSGIGGLDLGLERAGMRVVWQVENNPYCRKVLAKHWPDIPCYEDVTTLTGKELEPVDVICGGFPCQPVSVAGTQKGTHDKRWLWPEFNRLLRILRPRYAILENVPGLFTVQHGKIFGDILRDLAEGGYDAEWNCLPAAAVGAPHLRYRVFIIATRREMVDPQRDGLASRSEPRSLEAPARIESAGSHDALDLTGAGELSSTGRDVADADRAGLKVTTEGRPLSDTNRQRQSKTRKPLKQSRTVGNRAVADADRAGCRERRRSVAVGEKLRPAERGREAVADAESLNDKRRQQGGSLGRRSKVSAGGGREAVADADSAGLDGRGESQRTQQQSPRGDQPDGRCADRRFFDAQIGGEWLPEPDVGRVAHGIPSRVDRLRGLGNAVVVPLAEWIGQQVMTHEL